MKKLARAGSLACLLGLSVFYGCTGKEESSSGQVQKVLTSGEANVKAAIAQIIEDNAKALTNFPRTRDRQALGRHYAQDYAGIQDGKSESPKESEKFISDLEEQLNLGSPIGILNQVTNIQVQMHETVSWATYDYKLRIGIGGAVVVADEGKCTSIFKREGAKWLIYHEHCSTPHRVFSPRRL